LRNGDYPGLNAVSSLVSILLRGNGVAQQAAIDKIPYLAAVSILLRGNGVAQQGDIIMFANNVWVSILLRGNGVAQLLALSRSNGRDRSFNPLARQRGCATIKMYLFFRKNKEVSILLRGNGVAQREEFNKAIETKQVFQSSCEATGLRNENRHGKA